MKGSPQQPDPGRPGLRIPIRVARPAAPEVQGHEGDDALPEGGADTVRRMKITKGMLEVYGYTDGCPGCTHRRADLAGNRPHTEPCRTRIL